jgi:hypothetical protein
MRSSIRNLLWAPLLLIGCSNGDDVDANENGNVTATPAITATPQTTQRAPLILDHDFGIVPHGEKRTHEFELDLDKLGEPYVPLRVHLECSCGRADLRIRSADGTDRYVDGTGHARNIPREDEKLILNITLDTARKEAVDLSSTISRGYVLLQQLDDHTGMARQRWAFVVRFGIDAPIVLQPFAALDFGSIAQSMTAEKQTTIRGDENHPDMQFLSVTTTDQNLKASLTADDGVVILKTRCYPGRTGNHRAQVEVSTNRPDYKVVLEATWKVVPDLEAFPMNKISFSTRFEEPQDPALSVRQFTLVTDHNLLRKPEFLVQSVIDSDGNDASSMFEVKVTPVPTSDRQQRLQVRYLGGLLAKQQIPDKSKTTFRGQIILAKRQPPTPGAPSATLPIDLVVFPAR